MSGGSSKNGGITIIADFKENAVSLTGTPDEPAIIGSRSKNAGVRIIADFTDRARPIQDADSPESAPEQP